ncbi:MAG: xanthine dehydrogenase family protein molybdopterin-binding subunit [Candidatus Aminicenantes bacterium]|nr:xanthine dehydrogenase family protein molybdopterin-binding subunit [Candidatus Aminicenantes bacterium]
MSMTRRQFIASLGGTGLFYAFRFSPKSGEQSAHFESLPEDPGPDTCAADATDIDYSEWVAFGADGKVSVYTGRTELGQGLKTVITAIVTQALEIEQNKLTVVMGDTDFTPDDGSTAGSSSTRAVGWGFWLACEKIRGDVVTRASRHLRIPAADLEYRSGAVGRKGEPGKMVAAFELGGGEPVLIDVDPNAKPTGKQYVDKGIPNVHAGKIINGSLQFVNDLKKPGMFYAGWQIPPYHPRLTKLQSADLKKAQALPGVKMAEEIHGRVVVVGERYSDVLKGLEEVKTTWSKPSRSTELHLDECRANARLLDIKEEKGDVNAGLSGSEITLSETYTTGYTTHAPMETDTALAEVGNDRATVWVSSQHPHKQRELISKYIKLRLADVRAIGMAVGGGFGGKQANPVGREAARIASAAGAPVKLIYSRRDQFKARGIYKAACIIDLISGVGSDGKLLARKVDFFQDVGDGTTLTYEITNALATAYRDKDWPVGLAVTRGTSYVQTCFATESHMDMVAHKAGIDPVEFRRQNLHFPFFLDLIDDVVEKIGYGTAQLEADEGIGLAVVTHGPQFGAVAARVVVDRASGKVKIKHLCGTFDIGTVINRNTVTVGIRGAMCWGIGYALKEEIEVKGHSSGTEYLSQYHIPRFSDMPPQIDIAFIDKFTPNGPPRGCGEMPAVPTIGAIANAVYNAIGVRFYSIPITPEKVKAAL